MENKAHAIAAGLFVLVVGALAVALFMWLNQDTTRKLVYELSTVESVNGLSPQSAVKFRGINVGKVDSIGFDPKQRGQVLVTISVEDGTPISKTTWGTLGFQGVTGLAFVQLDDSGAGGDPLGTDAATPARIPMRPSLLSKLSDQGTTILVEIEEASRRMKNLLSPENQKAMNAALVNLAQAANDISSFSRNTDKLLDAQFGPERTNFPKLVAQTESALKEAEAAMRDAQTTLKAFNGTAAAANTALKDYGQVAKDINAPGGPLDQVSAAAKNLSAATQQLNQSTLPRMSRAADDTAKAATATSRTMDAIADNPQSLIYGNGKTPPGPGEPGFTPATR
jgi:phospholipid/cholesterol/gamma-HCH transport system substrate-binding protein